jgi:hypothetical protein
VRVRSQHPLHARALRAVGGTRLWHDSCRCAARRCGGTLAAYQQRKATQRRRTAAHTRGVQPQQAHACAMGGNGLFRSRRSPAAPAQAAHGRRRTCSAHTNAHRARAAAGRCARAPRRRPPLSKYALFCPARGGVQGCPTLSIVFMAMHATRAASVGCSRGERLGIVLGCAVRLQPCGGPSSSAAQDDRQHKVLVRTNSKTLSRRRGDGFSSVTGSKVEREAKNASFRRQGNSKK